MTKKMSHRRLSLSKNTLRALSPDELAGVDGGAYTYTLSSSAVHYSFQATSCAAVSNASPTFCVAESYQGYC